MSLTRHTPLRRTKPLRKWRRPKADAVTPALREAVLERDQGCIAPRMGALDPCSGRLTLDHVKDGPCMSRRAPSDLAHLLVLCEFHHLWSGWATANRPLLRVYLALVNR